METRLYTDTELEDLRTMPKRVSNPGARWTEKPKGRPTHRQRVFHATGLSTGDIRFLVFQRISLSDQEDFSCGLVWIRRGGRLPLARYNGPGHDHGDILHSPHIHRTSERAIATGKKPDSEAEETNRFHTIEGALACLITDCAVKGLQARPDQPRIPLT